jgi:predicted TIM-barrel fold metal-dependent hydrolase
LIGGYRVLDAHVHVQPWQHLKPAARAVMEAHPDAAAIVSYQKDPASFERRLDEEGVDAAVLVNYVAPEVMGFPHEVNAWVSSYCAGRARLVPMGSVNPKVTAEPAREVERLVRGLAIRALKVHPSHMLLYPHVEATPGLGPIYEAAQRLRVPVTIHSGTSVFPGAKNRYADPIYVDDVAVEFPDLRILLAHAGRPLWHATAFFLARRHANVFLDLSGIPPRKLLDALPRLAEIDAKCVWGTDWPSPGVRSMRRNVEDFLALPLSDAAKGRILWENGASLFGMT